MSQAYAHSGDMTEQYQVFVLPTDWGGDVSIRALEVQPENRNVAHHAIIGLDISGTAALLDAQDPALGYESFGGFGFAAESSFFGAWVPGALPSITRRELAGSFLRTRMSCCKCITVRARFQSRI